MYYRNFKELLREIKKIVKIKIYQINKKNTDNYQVLTQVQSIDSQIYHILMLTQLIMEK